MMKVTVKNPEAYEEHKRKVDSTRFPSLEYERAVETIQMGEETYDVETLEEEIESTMDFIFDNHLASKKERNDNWEIFI